MSNIDNNNKVLKSSSVLFILNLISSTLNYICQLAMARVLHVESYGTVNTIFSFMMIVAVPGTTLTMIAAKYYSSGKAIHGKSRYLIRQEKAIVTLTLVMIVTLFVLKNFLSKGLAIIDPFVLILSFLLAATGYFQPLYVGVFSGNKRFILVGVYSLFIPLYKLVAIGFSYLLSKEDILRLYLVLIIMFIGVVITAIYGHFKSFKIVGNDTDENEVKESLYSKEDVRTLFLNLSLMFYMNIDLLSLRYYSNESESGLYSSVLLFGRIIYFFSTTLGTILLPSVANINMKERQRKKKLNKALILLILFACMCMIPLNIFKEFFIKILYGEKYLDAAKYVLYVSVIAFSLSVYTIMINYVVGIGRTKTTTYIMAFIDFTLIAILFVLNNSFSILLAIAVVGVLGAGMIYIDSQFLNAGVSRRLDKIAKNNK